MYTGNESVSWDQALALAQDTVKNLVDPVLPQNAATKNYVERGSSVVECRTRNQVSPGSNPALLLCRRLGIFVLSIDAPVDSAV